MKLTFIVAAVAAAAVIAVAAYLDRKNTVHHRGDLEQRIDRELRDLRAGLGQHLAGTMALVEHLAEAVEMQPDLSPSEVEKLVDRHLARHDDLLAVGIAPGFEVYSVRPTPGIDSDPRPLIARQTADLAQRVKAAGGEAAAPTLHASADGHLTIAYPVMPDTEGGAPWGAMVAVFEFADVLGSTDLPANGIFSASGTALQVAIREIGGNGVATPIYGPVLLAEQQPMISRLDLPGGAWEIAAVPVAGWDASPQGQTVTRLIIGSVAALLILPIVLAGHLLNERNRHIAALKAREERLLELSGRFELAMQSSNIGIWEVREPEHHMFLDERAARLHGCKPSLEDGADRFADWESYAHPDDRERVIEYFAERRINAPGEVFEVVYRVVLDTGEVRHLRSVSTMSAEKDGGSKFTGIVWDVTADVLMNQTLQHDKETSDIKNAELELALDELSSRELELAELSHKFDLALASYNCGIWEADPANGGAVWDERMHQLYGLPFAEGAVTEAQWLSCLHPDDRKVVLSHTNKAIRRGQTLQSVQRVLLPDGDFRYVRSVGQLHTGRDGRQKIIGIAFDVTSDVLLTEELKVAKEEADTRNLELELAKSRIEFNALHDPLTMLGNRRKLDLELDELSRASHRERIKFSILHLDLDRFKAINDTLGHAAGDAMLVHASKVLARHVGTGDVAARIGGDEFVILAKGTTNSEQLAALAGRIIEEMARPIDFEGFSCRCGVSIGIAQANGSHVDARKVLVNADIALYQAKEKGRNCFEFFTHELQANIIKSKRLADEMLAGLERDEFTVWYQPQFDANTMHITGAEALVRWNHPERGVLASGAFLRAAEELNVMARIDQLVLEQSLRDKMRLAARGIRLPKISVNVSSKRLHDESLVESLRGLQITPGEICFELVESIFLDDTDDIAVHNIEKIKELGIDIEIDDFGTGHTSIVSLLKLKPKRLKIDRQLVMPILDSPQERTLVRSIIDIARSLGIESVAEGVETPQHAELLRQMDCDILQGFAFAKPLAYDDLVELALTTVLPKAS